MIALVLAMVWSRRGQAFAVALLTMLGVAAAVAAPAWLRATDRAIAAAQVAIAPAGERSFTLEQTQVDQRGLGGAPPQENLQTARQALLGLPGFAAVSAVEFPVVGLEPDRALRTLLVNRQDACAHLVMVAGRCLGGEGDVVIGEHTAQRLGLRVGQPLPLAYAVLIKTPDLTEWVPDGDVEPLLVAGFYRVPEPADVYWGTGGYFAPYAGRPGEPVFTLDTTMAVMDYGNTRLTINGIAEPGALAVDRLPRVRSELAALTAQVGDLSSPVDVRTGIPTLLDRIATGREAAHLIVPVPAIALILLSCLTIFLVVGYGTEGRRPELAVVALRGARRGARWWLATGENMVAILAGAVAGCVAGQLLVNAVAAVRLPGAGADPGFDSLRWAPVAAVAALVTALMAEWRQVLTPVSELLRRAPAVSRLGGQIAVQALVAALAVFTGVQLFVTGGTLTGVGTFATALIAVACAQLAARAVLPVVTRVSRGALRRGRPGRALAGFQLSRRPGATRMFALLAAAVAIAVQAACAVDTGTRGRAMQAELGTGADRVVTVEPIGRQDLLHAVREVDPDREFAMAVVRLPTDPGSPPALAVDTERLTAVANWPDDGDPAAAAKALRPDAPEPFSIPGAEFSVDVTATGLNADKPVGIGVVASSTAGLGGVQAPLGDLRPGRHTYTRKLDVCREGCRIDAIAFVEAGSGVQDVVGRVTVHTPAPGGWRASTPSALGPDGGLELTVLNQQDDRLLLQPVSTPYPLPAATTGTVSAVAGLDGRSLPVARAIKISAVPGAGRPASLVDLDYADRLTADGGPAAGSEVWLSDRAPADVLARLEEQGLKATGEVDAAAVRDSLDQQGPALALDFTVLIAVLAAALAAGALVLTAGVDRARRVEDLAVLRAQGLSRRAVRLATLWTYPALVAAAVLAGLGIALLTWWLTGWALPLAGLDPPSLPFPAWPRVWVVAAATAVVWLVLTGVAWLTGRRTLRSIP